MGMQNIKIGNRLLLGFTIITLFIVGVSLLNINSKKAIADQLVIFDNVTAAKTYISTARIEQVRFESDGSAETAAKVTADLESARTLVTEAHGMMKSEQNRNNVSKMLSDIDTFESTFQKYVTLETEKKSQGEERLAAAKDALDSIQESLDHENDYILSLTDAQQIKGAYNIFKLLAEVHDSFMKTRVATEVYVLDPVEENAKSVREHVNATKLLLQDVSQVINSEETLLAVQDAIAKVDAYESSFEQYNARVETQVTLGEEMRLSAVSTFDVANAMRDGVNQFIAALEVTTGRTSISMMTIAIVLSVLIAYMITRSITKPLSMIVKEIDQFANYDIRDNLTEDMINRKDEIGILSKSTHDIGKALRDIIKQILEASESVAASASQLSSSSQMTSQSADDIAKTIEEIAMGATDQAKTTEDGVYHINDFGRMIDQDQAHIQTLDKSVQTVNSLKNEGVALLNNLVEETKRNNEASKSVEAIVKETNISAEKIASASEMIQNITDQTNLLALNAAIEAARAGDAGRGFAVVAEEIRHLAEQSSAFTKDISETINDLISKATKAVETMEKSGKIVEAQAKGVSDTNEKFNGIATSVEDMKTITDLIQQSGKDMNKKKDLMIEVIQNLSAISEENAASTEEVSATIEEQTASMVEIMDASAKLESLAYEMQEAVNQFII